LHLTLLLLLLCLQVARLEDFVEAQVELIPDWQKALEVVQAVKK
jgi:hypothetical protein